jgi:hypothetical protein
MRVWDLPKEFERLRLAGTTMMPEHTDCSKQGHKNLVSVSDEEQYKNRHENLTHEHHKSQRYLLLFGFILLYNYSIAR